MMQSSVETSQECEPCLLFEICCLKCEFQQSSSRVFTYVEALVSPWEKSQLTARRSGANGAEECKASVPIGRRTGTSTSSTSARAHCDALARGWWPRAMPMHAWRPRSVVSQQICSSCNVKRRLVHSELETAIWELRSCRFPNCRNVVRLVEQCEDRQGRGRRKPQAPERMSPPAPGSHGRWA